MMVPSMLDHPPPAALSNDSELHVLVVARCPASRAALCALLFHAGLQTTSAGTFGVVELLLNAAQPFDAVVVTQSLEESTLFGVPQLMRSFDPEVPVLVLERDTAEAAGVVDLVQRATVRWPLRERACRVIH